MVFRETDRTIQWVFNSNSIYEKSSPSSVYFFGEYRQYVYSLDLSI